jgi:hypothetical protein
VKGFLAIQLALAMVLQTCGHKASAEPIVIVDDMNAANIESCVRLEGDRQVRECLYGEAQSWLIEISVGPGLPGTPGSEIFVPNAVGVLQQIVDRCNLGRAFLESGSDGQASLWVGHPDLTSPQIECVRSMERPGLRLVKNED